LGLMANYMFRFNAVRKMDYGGNKTLSQSQPYEAYTDLRYGTDPGADNVFGTSDDKTVFVYSVNPSWPGFGQVNDFTTNYDKNERNRLYTAYEWTLNKQYSNGWSALAGYTADYQKISNATPLTPNGKLYNNQFPYWSYALKMSATYD